MPQLGADFLQYGCGNARLGQREYLILIRSQTTNQRPADRTARTGDQNSHPASFQAASRSLVIDRGLSAVIGDDVGDQPRRLGLARIGADDVVGVRRLGPGLAGAVDAEGLALHLGADGAREHIREDEAGGGTAVRVLPGTLGSFWLKICFTVSPSPVEAAWPGGSAARASPAATIRPVSAFAARRAGEECMAGSPSVIRNM